MKKLAKASRFNGSMSIERVGFAVIEEKGLGTDEVFLTNLRDGNCGLLIVRGLTQVGLFRIEGTGIVSISANIVYSLVKDTASRINVYWETDQFKVQNKSPVTLGIKVAFLCI
jgi:hypothetical protein